jgi:hypothetical protein
MGRPRKPLWPPGHRGFESHTFRANTFRSVMSRDIADSPNPRLGGSGGRRSCSGPGTQRVVPHARGQTARTGGAVPTDPNYSTPISESLGRREAAPRPVGRGAGFAAPAGSVADSTPTTAAAADGEREDDDSRRDDCNCDPKDGSTKNSLHGGRPFLGYAPTTPRRRRDTAPDPKAVAGRPSPIQSCLPTRRPRSSPCPPAGVRCRHQPDCS